MSKSKKFKWRFDETEGAFIRESELSANWLFSEILKYDVQITKIPNDDVQKVLHILDESNLRMPDGKFGLVWLKEHLSEKLLMAEGKNGEVWHNIADRYRYIIEQIDMTLVKSGNYDEKVKIVKEEQKIFKRTPNNVKISFEPL